MKRDSGKIRGNVLFSQMGNRVRSDLLKRISGLRVAGYTAYCLWMVTVFYTTIPYPTATDPREALYLNYFWSIAALVVTLFIVARFMPHADRQVLDKRTICAATALMCVATPMVAFCEPGETSGRLGIIASALISGAGSGWLLLGWGRILADAGARTALVEASFASLIAAAGGIMLVYLPAPTSITVAIASAAIAGITLQSIAKRTDPPRIAKSHPFLPRTRRMFGRGVVASVIIGFATGFVDVIAGYRLFEIGDSYELLLLTGIGSVAAISILVIIAFPRDTITYVYRIIFCVLAFGCLSLLLITHGKTEPTVAANGGYFCFMVVLLAISIDISNFFGIRTTKVIGYAFFALYLGEALGSFSANAFTMNFGESTLTTGSAFVLVSLLLLSNLFLFTEKDLTETHIGELVDYDADAYDEQAFSGERPTPSSFTESQPRKEGGEASENPPANAEKREAIRTTENIASALASECKLSARETEVLRLVLKGRTIARMQEELYITSSTISTHIHHIYQKCGVRNRQELLDLVEERRT